MTTLQRTLTLIEIDGIAVAVRHDLDFNVTRLFDEFLDENTIVTKTRTRFVARALKPVETFVIVARNAHALATTTGSGLEHDRVANVLRYLDGLFRIFNDFGVAGNRVDICFVGQLLRRDLVAHRFDGFGLGPDERNAFLGKRLAEG